jgi:hypothetical protein
MRLLHIVTQDAELPQRIIEEQSAQQGHEVRVVDLRSNPDYEALLEEIFHADSIQVV